MNKHPILLLLGGSSLALTACASLGGTVSGDFNCRAPAGTCAPMSSIDDRAVAKVGAETAGPVREAHSSAHSRISMSAAPALARTPDRVMRIVFPAHVDRTGVLHEAAIAHAVVERGAWVEALTGPALPDTTLPSSRRIAPSSLREAIAGASAPAIEGLDGPPDDHAPHPFDTTQEAPDTLPSEAALKAARAGHRIGAGTSNDPQSKAPAPAGGDSGEAKPGAPGGRPTASASAAEQHSEARNRAAAVERAAAADRVAAANRAAAMARPALDAHGTKPDGTKPDIKGGLFPAAPGQGEEPR